MKIKSFVFSLLLATMICAPASLSAQVTIGSGNPPSQFSLLDLAENEDGTATRGFHLPRLDDSARRELTAALRAKNDPARTMGLVIYNTTINCMEFWMGSGWISLCVGDTPDPCRGLATMSTVFPVSSTIADLTAAAIAAGGNGAIQWYAQEKDGCQLDDNVVLQTATYWASNCADLTTRIPITVTVVNYSVPPTGAVATTFVNVMYDFQPQSLIAFNTGAGDAATWQWEVSTDNSNWTPIAGAESSTWNIPTNFVHDFGFVTDVNMRSRTLYFRCWLTNPAGTEPTNSLQILFIITTDGIGNPVGNFGITSEGTRYLVINRGADGNNTATTTGRISIALTNLGVNNTNPIGDFFQWGRVADGHERIEWVKNGTANAFGAGTSSVILVANALEGSSGLTASFQIPSNAAGYGKFINANDGWASWGSGANNTWGADGEARPGTAWSFPQNNPCQALLGTGWRVPSMYEFYDMYEGDGEFSLSGIAAPPINIPVTASGQTITWRPAANGAIGGVIITNDTTGEKVFIPAAGNRAGGGTLTNGAGDGTALWTAESANSHPRDLRITSTSFQITRNSWHHAFGLSVRCVRD